MITMNVSAGCGDSDGDASGHTYEIFFLIRSFIGDQMTHSESGPHLLHKYYIEDAGEGNFCFFCLFLLILTGKFTDLAADASFHWR